MIRINLLSTREIEAEHGRRQDTIVGVLAVGGTVALCLAVFLYQFVRTTMLQRELAGLKAEVASIEGKAKEVIELQRTNAALKEKISVIEDLSKKKVGPVRVMESLSASAPERLWLTEFKEVAGGLTLTGMAVDNQTIADFLKALQASQYFKDVELVETVQAQQDKTAYKKFSLKSRLVYQPQPDAQTKVVPQAAAARGGAKP
ncbi:MAG TPA: PilN domain-containing protein [Verrucomicrobiae bacterium]|jgi:type IV pilus assembly protein PilN|nr:PilN domain-containing protein [Verrucomicrobiae bacterium]